MVKDIRPLYIAYKNERGNSNDDVTNQQEETKEMNKKVED